MSNARPGQWVVIVGIGGLGHIGVQYAKAMGINVVAVVPPGSATAALAKDCGADIVYDGSGDEMGEFVQKEVRPTEASMDH